MGYLSIQEEPLPLRTCDSFLRWRRQALSNTRLVSAGGHEGDAVIACATGYARADLQLFISSLRRHHDGPVLLIVHDDPDLLAWLKDWQVDTLTVPEEPDPSRYIVVRRLAYARQAMALNPGWRRILFSDSRDVIFQGDPFFEPLQAPLEVYVEAENAPLRDHRFTRKWVERAFGQTAFEEIAERPALCAGTIVGERLAMMQLFAVLETILEIPREAVSSSFGADQAALNLAIHRQLVPAQILRNHQRVSTVGAALPPLIPTPAGPYARPDGHVPPVLHQYDRHPDMLAHVEAQFGYPLSQPKSRRRAASLAQRVRRLWASMKVRVPELR